MISDIIRPNGQQNKPIVSYDNTYVGKSVKLDVIGMRSYVASLL